MSKRPGKCHRPLATQHMFGEIRGREIGSNHEQGLNGEQLITYLDGREQVWKSFKDCETKLEARGWFDGFIQSQQRDQPTTWVRIYETLDLIRTTEWYWRDKGFDSFEDWWVENGHPLFGQWAELEQTYSYAKLAAPELFEVDYEEAKALAQSLAKFREVEPAAIHGGGDRGAGRKNQARDHALDLVTDSDFSRYPDSLVQYAKENGLEDGLVGLPREPLNKPVQIKDFILDVNHPQFREGFQKGVNANKRAGEDVYRRFARLRRDAPEVAGEFLEGKFVRRYKNGKVEPDLKAAEVAAGIRKPDQPVRRTDPLGNCQRLASKLNKEQLAALIKHCQSLLDQEVSK